MRILVTGSSGYLGQRIVRLLSEDPQIKEVIGLDIVRPKTAPDKLKFRQHDVTLPFEHFCEAVDAAIHLAFVVNPMRDESRQEKINLGGTANFIQAVRRHKVPVVIGLSSSVAYGAHPDNPEFLRETDPLRGNSDFAYARDKVRQEALFGTLRGQGITVKVVRPVVVLGPGVDNYISRYLTKTAIAAVAGQSPRAQFVHEEDVARAVVTLLQSGGPGPYNVAADGLLDIDTMARKLKRPVLRIPLLLLRGLISLSWALGIRSITEAPPGMVHYIAHPWLVDNSRLKKETGFVYKYGVEELFDAFVQSQGV